MAISIAFEFFKNIMDDFKEKYEYDNLDELTNADLSTNILQNYEELRSKVKSYQWDKNQIFESLRNFNSAFQSTDLDSLNRWIQYLEETFHYDIVPYDNVFHELQIPSKILYESTNYTNKIIP